MEKKYFTLSKVINTKINNKAYLPRGDEKRSIRQKTQK